MKKHFILPLLLFTLIVFTNAQTTTIEKQIDNVSETSLKANPYKIAGDEFEGRIAASKGDSHAIQYIATRFSAHGLVKPYPSSYLQAVPLVHADFSKLPCPSKGKLTN